MKICLSYRGLEAHDGVEKEVTRCSAKVRKLLTGFHPDLVQVHGAMELLPKKNEYNFSLNLVLPAATLHAMGVAKDVRSTVNAAFDDVARQVKKHKERLRHEHEWKRRRGRAREFAHAS
jgi:ribosome-associated translation inhibitor RaiA